MTESSLTHNDKTSTREALLKAAQELFTQKGFQEVSTRELAELAGVNLGAIQYYFGSKAQLFVQTISKMMAQSSCATRLLIADGQPKDRNEAAQRLCHFVHGYLSYLLRPQGPQACRLMFREIFSGTCQDAELREALVSSVVREFSEPLHLSLVSVIRVLVAPDISVDFDRAARSIMGQCSFYVIHRPFIERMANLDFAASPAFEQSVDHICRFTLMGLGSSKDFADEAIKTFQTQLSASLGVCDCAA